MSAGGGGCRDTIQNTLYISILLLLPVLPCHLCLSYHCHHVIDQRAVPSLSCVVIIVLGNGFFGRAVSET